MKMLCPLHEDKNPTMEVYDGYGFCFRCWKRVDLSDRTDLPKYKAKQPEDLEGTLAYVKTLRTESFRGLDLPTNGKGHFIIWPELDYYKFRKSHLEEGEERYMSPRGHKPTLFFLKSGANPGLAKTLIVVEGEINALSVFQAVQRQGVDVVSPGSAGNFISLRDSLVPLADSYQRVLVWTDKDEAGIKAAWDLVPRLVSPEKDVQWHLSLPNEDANDILVNQGTAALWSKLKAFIEGERQ